MKKARGDAAPGVYCQRRTHRFQFALYTLHLSLLHFPQVRLRRAKLR